MPKRQPRNCRRPGVVVRLTPRDEMMLAAVCRFRLCQSSDLARLYFQNRHRDVLADRLRRLFDAGFLNVHLQDRSEPNLYSLGPAGRAWAKERGLALSPPPRAGWEHHAGIVSAWARIAASAHAVTGVALVRFVPEWITRAQAGSAMRSVIPDAWVHLRWGQRHIRLALEVDLGNEGLTTLREKVRAYTASATEVPLGDESFTLLFALGGSGIERADRVRRLLQEEWPAPAIVLPLPSIGKDLFREVFPGAPHPVTASRFGNGRENAASSTPTLQSCVTGVGPSEE